MRESVGVAIAEQPGEGPAGRLIAINIIRSGWNSSGSRYYPAEVLERDIGAVYPKGTQVFIDHPRLSEQDDIPERSLTLLAGTFEDDPWPVREADGTLVMRTTVRVFSPWQPLIREAWQTIGVSINGGGTGEHGTREGRDGTIIDALTFGRSVDFVTVPGAGGRILGLMESHRPFESPEFRHALDQITTREAGSLGAFVESRIHLGFTELGDELYGAGRVTRDERIILSGAIGDALAAFVARLERDAPQLYARGRYADPEPADGDTVIEEAAERRTREATAEQSRMALDRAVTTTYGGEGCHTWVQDFDTDRGVVWFTTSGADESPRTWMQSYTTGQGTAVLTGDRVEVRARTVYEPVQWPGQVDGPPSQVHADVAAYPGAARAVPEAIQETTAGGVPAASDGPTGPANLKEGVMPEETKSPEIVAREAAEQRATTAELELARYRAGETASPIIGQLLAESGLPAAAQNKIRAEYPVSALPLRESGQGLDETALRARVAASVTAERTYVDSLLEANGAGQVRGVGAAPGAGAGMPAGYAPSAAMSGSAGGSFFGFPGAAGPAMSEQETREAAAADAAILAIWESRGIPVEQARKALAQY